jgi:hypothetical protein
MTNIINEQQQANKTLINEIELSKKQLAEKEENFKNLKCCSQPY